MIPTFNYDKVADVLYVTFGIEEPSFSENMDNMLILEKGFVSDKVIGFRILDISKLLK